MPHPRSAALIVAVPIALAAAGGPLAAAADESSKTPKRILADLKRDLSKVRTYHVAGTSTDRNGATRLAGDVSAAGRSSFTIARGRSSARLILLPSATYVKGNAAYWRAAGGATGGGFADRLAGRWVKAPEALAAGIASSLPALSPKRLAACAADVTGTLRKGGRASVGGRRAVVIVDRGDRPGTRPGRVFVTVARPVLALRMIQTGPRKPGGQVDPRCDDRSGASTASDLRFSAYDRGLRIVAPRGAITLTEGGGAPAGP